MHIILIKKISFKNFNNETIELEAETLAILDQDTSIAYCSGYHFDISSDEYKILN